MMLWLLAALAGSAAAVTQYRFGVRANARLPLVLRASVYTMACALVLDAPIGPASSVGHYVALDASASWQVAGNGALWSKARAAAEGAGGDTLLLLGQFGHWATPLAKDFEMPSLNKLAVENGVLRDYGIRPELPLRDNAYGVCRWEDRSPLVTSARAPGASSSGLAWPAR